MNAGRRVAALVLIAGVAAAAALAEVALGAVAVPGRDVLAYISGRGADLPEATRLILGDVRLPRAAMAACVGAQLGVAGVLLQGLLRNPLAEPYLLGIASGAGLGVAAIVLTGAPVFAAGIYLLPPAAFVGALAALLLVWWLGRVRGRLEITTLVLGGVVVSACLAALIQLAAALTPGRYFEMLSWMMGHLQPLTGGAARWTAAYAVAGLAAAWAQARDLNALALGEEGAAALGVRVERLKRVLFMLSSLLTAAAVSAAGLIGFVGLVAPHAARILVGPDHRILVPAAALCGAAGLLLADLAARTLVAPAELPAGVVTALVGGPVFLVLLWRHNRRAR